MVIKALVVAATMMINVRLASSVSPLTVGAPTVTDDSTTADVLEVTDADITDETLSELLLTIGGVEEAEAEVAGTATEVTALLVE